MLTSAPLCDDKMTAPSRLRDAAKPTESWLNCGYQGVFPELVWRHLLATIIAMDVVLDIASSIAFWRLIYPIDRTPKTAFCAMPGQCAHTWKDIAALLPQWVTPDFLTHTDERIHVLTLGADVHWQSKHHSVHAWGGPVPSGSFYDLGNSVFVESPPFMFLVAASILSPIKLIAFGCELCGLYSFDSTQKRGFRKRKKPLTSVARIRQCLDEAKGCHGYNNALRALAHVVDNSASPMETFDAMCMYLPYRLGGYCLMRPHMNYEVRLNDRAARIALRGTCYLDMGYPKAHLDVEHHGKLDHSDPEDQASDRARVNALKEMGFEVIELTNDQVDDVIAFDYIIQRIARLLGKRIRKEYLGATKPRMALRRELREWNRSSGRIR